MVTPRFCAPPSHSYATEVTFVDVINEIENRLLPIFDMHPLDNMHGLDNFYDAQAILMYAKAAWLKLLIYQQLVMLGAPGQYNDMAKQLASDAYQWLKARYDFHTNATSYLGVVAESSTPWSPQYTEASLVCSGWCACRNTLAVVQVYIRYSCRADANFWNNPLVNCFQTVGGTQDTTLGIYNCDWLDCTEYTCYTLPWDSTSPCSIDSCWQGTYNDMLSEAAQQLAMTTKGLLDSNGMQTVLANLSTLATTGLPDPAYAFYQRVGYPEYLCVFNHSSPDPTIRAAVARGRTRV